MAESTVLTNVWAAILAFAVFMYVVMDGFDLGIGILFKVFGVGRERDTAMNSIAPISAWGRRPMPSLSDARWSRIRPTSRSMRNVTTTRGRPRARISSGPT